MASTKGIAITAAIIVGVVGASMLVWLSPQGEVDLVSSQQVTASNINSFRTDEAFGSIYARHQNLATEAEFSYDRWKAGSIDASRMLQIISNAKTATTEMKAAIDAANTPEQWRETFSHYSDALASYSNYLNEMEMIVRSGNMNPDETTLNEYWQDSEEKVELAASAIPLRTS